MTDFLDEYLPDKIKGFPWTSTPRFSTTMTQVGSGAEHRNRNWLNPLHVFSAPEAITCHDELEDLKDHWMVCGGPFMTFPMRDPLDFASRRLVKANLGPTVFRTDQLLGVGDGGTRVFQLRKAYTRGSTTVYRRITLPILESVLIGLDALEPNDSGIDGGPYDFTVERETGRITFTPAPEVGVAVTAGFYFDVPARFESDDSFDQVVKAFQVDGYADLSFTEVRPCMSADASEGSG